MATYKSILKKTCLVFLLGMITIVPSGCGDNSEEDRLAKEMEECQKNCDRIYLTEGRLCFCTPTVKKKPSAGVVTTGIQSEAQGVLLDGDSEDDLAYSGSTAPVRLSKENSHKIAITAWNGGFISQNAAAGELDDEGVSVLTKPRFLSLYEVLNRVFLDLRSDADPNENTISQRISNTRSLRGSCGGTATFDLSESSKEGDYKGKGRFNEFCDKGKTVSGSLGFIAGISAGKTDLRISSCHLLVLTPDDSFSVAGKIRVKFSSPRSSDVTMDLLIKEDQGGKVFQLKSYEMTIYPGMDSSELNLKNAEFYDPDHGFVILTTPAPVTVLGSEDAPSAGTLAVIGQGGEKVTVDVYSSAVYQVVLNQYYGQEEPK